MKAYSQAADEPESTIDQELEGMAQPQHREFRLFLAMILQAIRSADGGDREDRDYFRSSLFREHAQMAGLDPDAVQQVLMRRYSWAR